MTAAVCRWCHKSLADHREETAPMARMPCGGRKSGFAPRPEAEPTPLSIFSKPMRNVRVAGKGIWFDLTIGPFSCSIFPGTLGKLAGRWMWNIEIDGSHQPFVDGDCDTSGLAAAAIEKALTDIEAAIRQARGA